MKSKKAKKTRGSVFFYHPENHRVASVSYDTEKKTVTKRWNTAPGRKPIERDGDAEDPRAAAKEAAASYKSKGFRSVSRDEFMHLASANPEEKTDKKAKPRTKAKAVSVEELTPEPKAKTKTKAKTKSGKSKPTPRRQYTSDLSGVAPYQSDLKYQCSGERLPVCVRFASRGQTIDTVGRVKNAEEFLTLYDEVRARMHADRGLATMERIRPLAKRLGLRPAKIGFDELKEPDPYAARIEVFSETAGTRFVVSDIAGRLVTVFRDIRTKRGEAPASITNHLSKFELDSHFNEWADSDED